MREIPQVLPHKELKLIPCECGCGILIESWDKNGRKRRFLNWEHFVKGYHPTDEQKKHLAKINSGKISPMKGKHHTEESIQKMREAKRNCKPNKTSFKKGMPQPHGKDHWNWKGGLTSFQDLIRNSEKYSNWRTQVFGRDNFTCQHCGVRGTWLEAHHIISLSKLIEDNSITSFEEAISCDNLWDLNNGITYCKDCHKLLKQKSGKL